MKAHCLSSVPACVALFVAAPRSVIMASLLGFLLLPSSFSLGNATVITENVVVDVNSLTITDTAQGSVGRLSLSFSVPSVTLNAGDQYDLNLSFLPGQSINVTTLPCGVCTTIVEAGDGVVLSPGFTLYLIVTGSYGRPNDYFRFRPLRQLLGRRDQRRRLQQQRTADVFNDVFQRDCTFGNSQRDDCDDGAGIFLY